MSSKKEIDIHEFAQKVERMCDFFLSKTERDGSEDRKIVEDLKETAADLAMDNTSEKNIPIHGLRDFMKGV